MYKEPWFGKKDGVWGLRPISWQGWLASTIFFVLLVGIMLIMLVNSQYVVQLEIASLFVILFFMLLVQMTAERNSDWDD